MAESRRPMTVPVRVPDEIYGEVRMWSRLKGITPGDMLQEAWAEWLHAHKDEILAELDAIRTEVESA